MRWISVLTLRLDAKAIRRPSGDQVGEESAAGLFVRFVSPEPSVFST